MKGLQENQDAGRVFLVIKHDSICQESRKEKEGFEPIEVLNPQTKETAIKYIKRYKGVEALVTKIEWRDTKEEFDQRYMSWKIYMDAAGIPCILELPFNSRASSRFMKLAENIDYSKPVEFRAWRDQKTKSTAFFVGQDDKRVPQKYSKETPFDCPEPTQKFDGSWDFDKQKAFLWRQMIDVVIPKVEATAVMTKEAHEAHENGNGEPEFDSTAPEHPPEDDYPF